MRTISSELFSRAQVVLPGGVNSPVRAFRAVGGSPVFIHSAQGSKLTGADGETYIDYIGSWGPMILGHNHPKVIEALIQQLHLGTSFGAPTELEVRFAEEIKARVPSVHMMRMTSSGTEAVMGALRVARGFTGRTFVVKFEGCYHGGADYLLVKAGSGLATLGTPSSAGVPKEIAGTTIVLPYNDIKALTETFQARGHEIAAVILEPVVGNMGLVPPAAGFLEALRSVTSQSSALLVFDEVMTGFRLAKGGAQERYGVTPDLTCFGKIIGGGLPVGAYGGRDDIMKVLAPLGPVYQAGTLSGNPLATTAGLATLQQLSPALYERLEATSGALESALNSAANKHSVELCVQRVGSMLTGFFCGGPVSSWDDAAIADTKAFGVFHQSLLADGIMWPPSQFEAAFVSAAHSDKDVADTATAFDRALAAVAKSR